MSQHLPNPHLLIVDDNEEVRRQLQWGFSTEPYTVLTAGTAGEALDAQRNVCPQVAILDLGLPPDAEGCSEGLRCLQELLAFDPRIRVIVVTGHHDMRNAQRCISGGACDFCRKPVNLEELKVIVRRAFFLYGVMGDEAAPDLDSKAERDAGGTPNDSGDMTHGIVTRCKAMADVLQSISKVAASNAPVLITGESGTGKELVAKAIHDMSRRSAGPLVTINCGAIPEHLLEAEFFGHEKGAFTGATQQVRGKVEYADQGTLFLDEVGDLPLAMQVKLLRFLQEMVIQRVGGRQDIAVDVRIVAATNVDIDAAIKAGTFREDLYYRIGVVNIGLPPLRERGDDAVLLARHFLKKAEAPGKVTGLHPSAEAAIRAYPWPGNVRELENRVRRALIFASGTLITPEELDLEGAGAAPTGSRAGSGGGSDTAPDQDTQQKAPLSLKEARGAVERRMVLEALERHAGNILRAAQALEISRPTFYDLLKKHGIEP